MVKISRLPEFIVGNGWLCREEVITPVINWKQNIGIVYNKPRGEEFPVGHPKDISRGCLDVTEVVVCVDLSRQIRIVYG